LITKKSFLIFQVQRYLVVFY